MLNASHLRKQYATVLAVGDVSLTVERGKILGLLGPNGAGKTTTIRMILNIIQPDAGSITFEGRPFDESMRNRIGYLPEERGLYRKNKLLNTIVYFASLRGIETDEAKRRAYDWLKRFDLLSYYDRKVEELSKGNQQKVQFIISILHNPQLVILDEPFSGLDPINQILLKDILLELKQQGKAVIFSTHQMDQAEKLCDTICLINRGNVVLEGELREVKQRFGKNSVHIEFDGDGGFLSSLPSVKKVQVYENYAEIVMEDYAARGQLLAAVAPNIDIRKFEYVEPSLNSIFLDVVGHATMTEQPIPVQSTKDTPGQNIHRDKRVKADLIRLIIAVSITFAFVIALFVKKDLSWTTAGIFFVASIFSLLKYMKTRNNVIAENRQQQNERHQ
jgi:ABC-2 type transport system ATP-binding protein